MKAWLVLGIALALSGCAQPTPQPSSMDDAPVATIQGFVMDAALAPVPGANVSLGGSPLSDISGADGAFSIVAPGDQRVYALRIVADGFVDSTHPLQSNDPSPVFDEIIQINRLPVIQPTIETISWTGNLACTWFAQVGHSHGGPGDPGAHNSNDCSEGANEEVWEFTLEPGVRNVVLEARWNPNSQLSERMAMFVEGLGVDDGGDVLFSFNEDVSGVQATISQLQSSTYYGADGGTVRVTVKIGAPEEDLAVGVAINQEFQVLATAFYVLPGPSNYSPGAG